MLRSCSACGRIHDSRYKCAAKRKQRQSQADRFRNTAEWQRARDAARERDMNLCVWCRHLGDITIEGLSVHHIVPLEEDYSLRADLDNLVTLCAHDHEAAERGDISRAALINLIRNT